MLRRKLVGTAALVAGAVAAFGAAIVTWFIAQAILRAASPLGVKLEAITGFIAIVVLLVVLNWFVHKAYWTGWMATFQKKKVAITGTARERRAAEESLAASTDTSTRRATAIASDGLTEPV